MATSVLTARQITDLRNHIVLLPQGGIPEPATNGQIILEAGELFVRTNDKWYKVNMAPVQPKDVDYPLNASQVGQ